MGHGQRSKDPERMRALALAAAGSSDDDERPRPKRKSSRKRKPTIIDSGNSFDPLEVKISSDADDDDFVAEESGTESSKAETDGSDIQELTNAEIAESLPAKTVPRRSNAAHQTRTKTLSVKQKKRKDRSDSLGSPTARTTPSGSKKSRVTVEEVEDEEDIGPSQSTLTPPVASSSSTTQIPKASTRTNPIYLFYELVALNANKLPGELGDKHYKCYHDAEQS
ncbi:hypothetical protein PILCRDRAFT_11298 [Piloderma croceum F 1598]|uniref:Uncharacterized protein n=1 Tax=Piloderma croceum (strain F 1598) TaxID=765440 RepID=A0A0C3FEM0_PILCF|nr:hypothetical protein PILCRDRAFT_11298 [Piloderma croceum F 1598]